MKIRYGTSGNPPNFFKSKFGKDRVNAPDWIKSIGLNAYERMMTYGARMKEEDAFELGKKAKINDIFLSVHAPYYIVLTSDKPNVIKNSIKEMLKTVHLSDIMGAKRIIFHPGFGRDFKKVIKNIKIIEKENSTEITIHPETMGKKSQLGSLNDVLSICENTNCLPCIDFAHIHARENGSLMKKEDFKRIIIEIEKRLGNKVLKELHCHFYPVEFTDKGEKIHRAVTEKNVFPIFQPFGELIKEFKMSPILISESRDSQDIGALHMKNIMENLGIK
jgi:deoxyribonuclease-4